jgi:hypothetical protein
MSRYSLQPREQSTPEITIALGWDDPLNTFFAQVDQEPPKTDPDADPIPLLNLGMTYNEIQDVETVVTALKPWADVPEHVQQQLLADQANHANWQESPVQSWVRQMFGNLSADR